jgi:hypothetical protein
MGYNQRKDIIHDTMHSMGRDWELVARYDNSRGPAMYLRELTPCGQNIGLRLLSLRSRI